MSRVLDPFRFVLVAVARWMNQRQLQAIEYLREANRVLREQLGVRHLRFTDDQRRRLSVWASFRTASRSCCTTHSALGCRVTLTCRTRRRPCSITKKQYSSWNVNVGTVKKSKATMTFQ